MVLSPLSKTWIFDLDGTLIKHNGYLQDGVDSFLPNAKEFMAQIPREDMVVFITSRKETYREQTEQFLINNGVRYDHIIFSAPYGERILVNDRKPSGLKMAHSINLCRDEFHIDYRIDETL